MASLVVCGAQIPVSFSTATSKSTPSLTLGGTPSNIYTADLNNDGIPDIIQDVGFSPAKFAVSLGRGDGTFKALVEYYYPGVGTATPRAAMAFGDFNGDGNIDVAVAMIGTRKVAVYLGNGDGTLQAPKITTLVVPSGFQDIIASCQLAAADFNKDGKLDLAVSTGIDLHILPGNGDGTFAGPKLFWYTNFGPGTIYGLAVGDFDGDGIADVAVSYSCNSTEACGSNTQVLGWVLGDGNLSFRANWTLLQVHDTTTHFIIATGDLDRDGRSDVMAIMPGSNPLVGNPFVGAWYGQAGGNYKFSLGVIASTGYGSASGLAPQFVVGDFNDDGRTDFAISADWAGGRSLQFFLGTSSLGIFSTQTWNLPYYANQTNVVAGLFNRDLKPDVALVQYNSAGSGNSVITSGLNATQNGVWSNCSYLLQGRGISLCSPTDSSDGAITLPVNFNAAAHSFGQIRDMVLWVDGKWLATQHNVWENSAFFNSTATLAAGAHQGKILATDIDATLQQLDFAFTVGASNCSPPGTNAVRICSLIPTSSAVVVQAAATVSGTLARMEVWTDGRKMYTAQSSPNLSASIGLTPGTHMLDVLAVNTAGTVWKQTATVTVP